MMVPSIRITHLNWIFPLRGTYSQNEAWLRMDLLNETNVVLRFNWKEFNDELDAQDGIYLSDDGGTNFTKVYDFFHGQFDTWYPIQLDISALAAANNLSLSSDFVIKFQQYDNYPKKVDGYAFDSIYVYSSPVALKSPIVEPEVESEVAVQEQTPVTEELQDEISFSIYPNPATNDLNIVGDLPAESGVQVSLAVYDAKGQRIYTDAHAVIEHGRPLSIDISRFPAGLYFCSIETKGLHQSLQFVKQ